MKRAVNIFFWISLIIAVAVVMLRKDKPAPPTVESSSPMPAPAPANPPPQPEVRPAPAPDARSAVVPNEAALMRQIRDNVQSNPALALQVAQEARKLFQDSPESDERDKLLVEALINLQRIGEARVETGYYYRHHPNGRYAGFLFTMTGARPDPPSGPAP
jgi:hypothetical protein